MKSKTFHPICLRLGKSLGLFILPGIRFGSVGFISLECKPFIYDELGSCPEGESFFPGLPLRESREEGLEAAIPASVILMAVSSLPAQHFPQPGAGSSIQTTFYSGGILSGFSPQPT